MSYFLLLYYAVLCCSHFPGSDVKLISIIDVIYNMVVFDAVFADYVIFILTVVVFLVGVLTFFVLLLVDWEAICLSNPTPVELFLGFI